MAALRALEEKRAETGVPAVAVCRLRGGVVDEVVACGTGRLDGQPVDEETVFEAASLSKPFVAFVVLRLVAEGEVDLDTPLELAGEVVTADPRLRAITPRRVLSHTTGLPNWRAPDGPLRLTAEPGTVGYSGEAFDLLLTDLGRHRRDIGRRLAGELDALGMGHSSFTWRPEHGHLAAVGHDERGRPRPKGRPTRPKASGSLHTTAADYGAFVAAALWSDRVLPEALASLHRTAQVDAGGGHGRTLGWAVAPSAGGDVLWQHGDNPGFKHLVVADPARGDGLVVLTNGDAGRALARQLAEEVTGARVW